MNSSASVEPLPSQGKPCCRRRPLLGIALVFVAGTALGLWLTPPLAPLLVAAGFSLSLVAADRIIGRAWSAAAVYVAVALIACAAVSLRTSRPSPRVLAVRQLERQTEEAELRIQVSGDPVAFVTQSGRPAWEMPATILAWYDATSEGWRRGAGTLTMSWRAVGFRPAPRYGDRWRVRGNYYATGRFWARQTTPEGTDHGSAWIAHCYNWRRTAADRLANGVEGFPGRTAVVRALLLGLRRELEPSVRDLFARTGTLHVMAISGLHVGVMTGLIVFVLKSLGLSRETWFYLLAPLLIAYTMATGARPSAVRACIMALAYWSALPLRRRPDAPSALALAALIILVYDPRQLATPGFLFSFLVVAGLLVFFNPLYSWLTRPLRSRQRYKLPVPRRFFRRELDTVVYAGAGLIAVSVIAWFMAAPLSARFFGRVSLVSLPANLLVVPLVFLMVVTGCLSLAAGSLIPVAGIVFNAANLVWAGALLRVLPWFAAFPGASVTVSFPAWALPLWYGALAWLGWRLHAGPIRD